MDDILGKSASEIAGLAFDCSCGKRHLVNINNIYVGNNIVERITRLVTPFNQGTIFLIADSNTYEVLGRKVENILQDYKVKTFIFESKRLIPNETALGRLLVEIEDDTSLILVVGSGVLNDLARYMSKRVGVSYAIIGTAPSMDGYASVVSPIIVDGVKRTLPGVSPLAIISDTEILKNAPFEMLQAGLGDMLGKLTALADWELSKIVNSERYCNTIAQVVKDALYKCINNIEGLVVRNEEAVKYVMEGLILSGVAIGLQGNSRPASGAEHNFAHYWDMDAIVNNRKHPLHGNSVAVGTVITAHVYGMVKEYLPNEFATPKTQQIINYIKKTKSVYSPKELGISRELFIRSMHEAMDIKDRYTVFHLARERGKLDSITKALTIKFYS